MYSWYVWPGNMYSTKVSVKANEAWGSVHTPGEYENAVLSTELFGNAFKTVGFRVNGRHFKNGTFRKRWRHDYLISQTEFSSNTNSKRPVMVAENI